MKNGNMGSVFFNPLIVSKMFVMMKGEFLENQSIPTLMSGKLQQLAQYQRRQELLLQGRQGLEQ